MQKHARKHVVERLKHNSRHVTVTNRKWRYPLLNCTNIIIHVDMQQHLCYLFETTNNVNEFVKSVNGNCF